VAGATSNLAAAPEKRDASKGWKRRGKIGVPREKAAPVYNTRGRRRRGGRACSSCKDAKLTKSFVLSAKTKDAEQSYGKRYPITTRSLSFSRILSDLSISYFLCIPIERLKFHADIIRARGMPSFRGRLLLELTNFHVAVDAFVMRICMRTFFSN
jgi:hypothetical protein